MKDWKTVQKPVENKDDPHRKALLELEVTLQSIDWFFSRSDDPEVYRAGLARYQAAHNQSTALGDEGIALFKKYQEAAWNR